MGCPQERAIASIHSMLSRKKGKRYGEGHQKAPQISICMLPLAHMRLLEGAMCPPGLKHRRNTCVSLGACLFFLAVGRVLLFPHDGCGGREMMVYLITKRLKYPLQRSSYDGDQVVRRSHGSL
jgi:hypothetical protein